MRSTQSAVVCPKLKINDLYILEAAQIYMQFPFLGSE